jgi:hypothetical protein
MPFSGKFQVGEICHFTAIGDWIQESYQNCIDLAGHEIRTIRDVPSFLYLGDYNNVSHVVAEGNSTSEASDGDGMSSESSIHNEIYRHLRVYVTADMFGIDDSKKISKKRLARWVEQKWSEDSFPLLAGEILRSSPPHDKELSSVLANVIAKNIASFTAKGSMLDVLKSSGRLAVSVLEIVVACLADSEGERERLVGLCINDTFGRHLMSKVNKASACRHCNAGFYLRVEEGSKGWGSRQCGRCRAQLVGICRGSHGDLLRHQPGLSVIAEEINHPEGVKQPAAILSGSISALQAIQNPSNKSGQRIIRATLQAASEMKARGIPIRLQWVPGHCDDPGNDEAVTGWPCHILNGSFATGISQPHFEYDALY